MIRTKTYSLPPADLTETTAVFAMDCDIGTDIGKKYIRGWVCMEIVLETGDVPDEYRLYIDDEYKCITCDENNVVWSLNDIPLLLPLAMANSILLILKYHNGRKCVPTLEITYGKEKFKKWCVVENPRQNFSISYSNNVAKFCDLAIIQFPPIIRLSNKIQTS